MLVGLVGQLTLVVSGVIGARLLGVTDRGNLALFLLFVTIATQLGSLGLPLALTYWIARDGGLSSGLRRLLTRFAAWQILVVTALQAAVLAAVFHSSSPHVQIAAAISLPSTPANLIYLYGLASVQGQRRFALFNSQRLAFPVLYAAMLVVLAVTGQRSLKLVVLAWSTSMCVSALATAYTGRLTAEPTYRHNTTGPPSLRAMIAFGVKGLLGSVAPLESFQFDQAIVGLFISSRALGLYVVAVAFTNLPRFIGQSIGLVAFPHVASQHDALHRRRTIVRFVGLTVVLCGLAVLATEVALPWLVPRLFGRAFTPAVPIARILLLSALVVSMRRVLSDCARGTGHPGIGTTAEVLALVLFPPTLGFMQGGPEGVAWALVISGTVALGFLAVRLIRAREHAVVPGADHENFPPLGV